MQLPLKSLSSYKRSTPLMRIPTYTEIKLMTHICGLANLDYRCVDAVWNEMWWCIYGWDISDSADYIRKSAGS